MKRPNILFIITDQQRWDTMGCYGNEQIFTPGFDRLASEGVVFERCYTSSPECVPARAVMMTGLAPHRTGCFSNSYALSPDAATFQRILRDAGYLTQAIGKMHFRPSREGYGMERLCLSEEIPGTVEQDEFLTELHTAGFQWAEEPHGMRSHMYYVPQVSQLPDEWHTTTWTGRKTIEFIEAQARGDRPWLCWTGFMKPHPPFEPTVPFNTLYDPVAMPLPARGPQCKDSRSWWQNLQNVGKWMDLDPDPHLCQAQKAHYWACVSMVDRQVGRILDALDRTGQRENTLLVFNSDHGELLGDHHSWGKRSWYEGAGRVPLLVSWPGHVPEGERRTQLTSHVDLLPTFLAAVGLDLPQGAAGANLLEVAADASARTRDVFVGQFHEKGHGLYLAMDAQWKYMYCAADGKEQLFNYTEDPDELKNRADDPGAAGVKARLKGAAVDYFRAEGYRDPLDGDDWRTYPPSQTPMERVLQIGKTRHGIVAGYRQYASWNGRDENLFTPEGRMD
jgi:choline-sulfatase